MVWELAVEVEGAEEEALTESLLIGNLRERREREAKWRLEKEALGSGVSLRVEKKTLSILMIWFSLALLLSFSVCLCSLVWRARKWGKLSEGVPESEKVH